MERTYNIDGIRELFCTGPWYVHANDVVEVTTVKISCNAHECIEPWFNNEASVRYVAFMDRLFSSQHLNENFDDIFEKYLKAVRNHELVSVAKWQEETGGRTLLVANNEYFAIMPIAMMLGVYLDPKLWDMLKNEIEKMQEDYIEDCKICSQTNYLSSQHEIVRFACVQYMALHRKTYSMWYGATPDELFGRAISFFNKCDILALKYLMQ